jgi:hypothetical protein
VILAILVAAGWWGEAPRAAGSVAPVAAGLSAAWFAAALVAWFAWGSLRRGGRAAAGSPWPVWWTALAAVGYVAGAPFPAARFLVFLLPPLAAWFALDATRRFGRAGAGLVLGATVAGNLWLSVSLARADFVFARFARDAAAGGALEARQQGLPLITTGHWGLQYYVELAGGRVLARATDRLPRGAILLEPAMTDHLGLPERIEGRQRGGTWEAAPRLPAGLAAACFSGPDAASWYGGDVWLPFALGRAPVERMRVFRILPAGTRP